MSDTGRKDFSTSMFTSVSCLAPACLSSVRLWPEFYRYWLDLWLTYHILFSQRLKRNLRPTPLSLHSRRSRKPPLTPLTASLVAPCRMTRNRTPRLPSTRHSAPMMINRAAPPLPCEFSLPQGQDNGCWLTLATVGTRLKAHLVLDKKTNEFLCGPELVWSRRIFVHLYIPS
jgi:hypothetical protein